MLPESTTVLIVGAGPAGLCCAVSLLAHGVKPADITVVDAQPAGLNLSRAIVIHAQTLEDLASIGAAEPIVARGFHSKYMRIQAQTTVLARANFPSLESYTQFPYALLISQADTEQLLLEKLKKQGVVIHRPCKVTDMHGSDDGLRVAFEGGEVMRARFVVGADGSRSTIRKLANIPFRDPSTGKDPHGQSQVETTEPYGFNSFAPLIIADVYLAGHIPPSVSLTDLNTFMSQYGYLLVAPLPAALDDPEGRTIFRLSCAAEPGAKEITKARLQQVLKASIGLPDEQTPIIDTILWSSTFRVKSAVADKFFQRLAGGVVALVGDAAHVHSPAGGQGMNLGLRDAVRLGEILADITRFDNTDATVSAKRAYIAERLGAFSDERRSMAIEVIKMTKLLTWMTGLQSVFARTARNIIWWLMGRTSLVNNGFAWRLSGLRPGTKAKQQ
ncbi:unnamed protein product [Somion occarium]|uniref:FAD-binding domain-containing protein n=1 Tax=Somion occarium TaxID=3059160 RepID=A0ABP1D3G4_9APHY